MNNQFYISSSPHIKDQDSIPKIMFGVIFALIPAGLWAIHIFGLRTLWIISISIGAALFTEVISELAMKRPISITDGSAILTGILVAYNIPPEVPLWIPVVGSGVGILIGKQIFGGLGHNPMNPALIGRAFLMASWPVHMTIFQTVPKGGTLSGIDIITSATPLNIYKHSREIILNSSEFTTEQVTQATEAIYQLYGATHNLFFGKIGGCIGETSVFLLLIGAAFLMYKRIIGWKIPTTYVGTVALLTWIFGGTEGFLSGNPLFHILSGGLILGAFYMATDMVTTPITFKGRLIFGAGCGIITVIIRLWGGYPEGVSYSILLMNLTTPLLNKYFNPKVFGGK